MAAMSSVCNWYLSRRSAVLWMGVGSLMLTGAVPQSRRDGRQVVLLMGTSGTANVEFYDAFKQAFLERHPRLATQVRWLTPPPSSGNDQYARNVEYALRQGVDLIVARNAFQAQVAHRIAPRHALLFWSHVNPWQIGLLRDSPGITGMATGVWVNDEMDLKRLEVLLDAFPSLRHVGLLVDAAWMQVLGASVGPMQAYARAHGVQLEVVQADNGDAARTLVEQTTLGHIQAWCLPRTTLTADGQIAARLATLGRPVIAAHTPDVYLGAHLSYSHDRGLVHPALADLAARILEGEAPGSIPVQTPHRYQLAVRITNDSRLPPMNPAVVKRADLVVRP